MINTIGYRQSEMALQLGTLFTTEEALKVGMVDRIVPQEEVVQEAINEVRKWQKIPGMKFLLKVMMLEDPFGSWGKFLKPTMPLIL